MPETITFDRFRQDHLDGALNLSRAADWPHRRADWEFVLGISKGIVALTDGRVVGTAVATPFGAVAMANMIIVDAALRGRGLGRSLMDRIMPLATPQEWRLVATTDGLPLYEKLGYRETGRIVQMQGKVAAIPAPEGVEWATADDLAAIAALDQSATGADRARLFAALAVQGRLAVIRGAGRLQGFAALRSFGRGEVAGPVAAASEDEAKRLLSFIFAHRPGAFLRVDTTEACGLATWLEGTGLASVAGGIAMQRGGPVPHSSPFLTYALAAQALG